MPPKPSLGQRRDWPALTALSLGVVAVVTSLLGFAALALRAIAPGTRPPTIGAIALLLVAVIASVALILAAAQGVDHGDRRAVVALSIAVRVGSGMAIAAAWVRRPSLSDLSAGQMIASALGLAVFLFARRLSAVIVRWLEPRWSVTPATAETQEPSAPSASGDQVPVGMLVGVVLALTLLARGFLAGKNSYWLDELYSVDRYVLAHESLGSALRDLARTSVHPPLYQAVLYGWIQLFGDSETTTRTLSNLYATGAAGFTFLLARRWFGSLVGIAATVGVSISYAVMYYGMESRSYAQTLLLATISSFALLHYLDLRRRGPSASPTLLHRLWPVVVLCLANAGLLLTHYYNAFFVAAQGLFALGFIRLVIPKGRRLRMLGATATNFVAQVLVFIIFWGQELLDTQSRTSENGAGASFSVPSAIAIFRSTTGLAYDTPRQFDVLVTAVAILTFGLMYSFRIWRRQRDEEARDRLIGVSYLVTLLAAAPLAAWIGLSIATVDQFRQRYTIYLVPAFIVMLTLVIVAGTTAVSRRASEAAPRSSRRVTQAGPVIAIALTILIISSGGIRASAYQKADWRGSARQMAAIVSSDPDSSYAIYEPSFRSTPSYDYYLNKYLLGLEVTGTILRGEERQNTVFQFERDRALIAEFDYLMIPFVHHRTTAFSHALESLQETYSVHFWQIDRAGRGLVIFSIHGYEPIDP